MTVTTPPTLADLGATKDQSSKWQKSASVPEEQFQAALDDPEQPKTTAAMVGRHDKDSPAWLNWRVFN